MGLRINNNISALRALRNLRINDRNEGTSLERLSTGLKINRASDDPSGLVISEQLRAQIGSLKQAVDNSQNASGLIGTADAALQGVSDLLSGIKDSAVFALNEGGSSPEQVAAEQASVDQAIAAISRIANTTRYGDRSLLNGASDLGLLSSTSASLNDLIVRQFEFSPSVTSSKVDVVVPATAGAGVPTRRTVTLEATTAPTVLRITGDRGTADITLASSSSAATVATAVNGVASVTGVYASGVLGVSEEFGSKRIADIQVVSGSTSGHAAGTKLTTVGGFDAVVTINGNTYTGDGRFFNVQNATLTASFSLDPSVAAGTLSFKVHRSGLNFQLNERAAPTDAIRIGIQSIAASVLGGETITDKIAIAGGAAATTTQLGFLESLKTGGTNDLDSNPGNASKIVDKAIDQVTALRGYLGAIQAHTIQPNIDSLGVTIENLTASESSIRDLDFAEETSRFTRNQILFQAGTSVLASANLIPQSVLTLLR